MSGANYKIKVVLFFKPKQFLRLMVAQRIFPLGHHSLYLSKAGLV